MLCSFFGSKIFGFIKIIPFSDDWVLIQFLRRNSVTFRSLVSKNRPVARSN